MFNNIIAKILIFMAISLGLNIFRRIPCDLSFYIIIVSWAFTLLFLYYYKKENVILTRLYFNADDDHYSSKIVLLFALAMWFYYGLVMLAYVWVKVLLPFFELCSFINNYPLLFIYTLYWRVMQNYYSAIYYNINGFYITHFLLIFLMLFLIVLCLLYYYNKKKHK